MENDNESTRSTLNMGFYWATNIAFFLSNLFGRFSCVEILQNKIQFIIDMLYEK